LLYMFNFWTLRSFFCSNLWLPALLIPRPPLTLYMSFSESRLLGIQMIQNPSSEAFRGFGCNFFLFGPESVCLSLLASFDSGAQTPRVTPFRPALMDAGQFRHTLVPIDPPLLFVARSSYFLFCVFFERGELIAFLSRQLHLSRVFRHFHRLRSCFSLVSQKFEGGVLSLSFPVCVRDFLTSSLEEKAYTERSFRLPAITLTLR